jgi:hypothetical protein
MATLPTIPSFDDGDYDLTKLQQLSAAVQFVSDLDVKPTWHLYRNSTQSMSNGSWNASAFTEVAFDGDSIYSSNSVEIVTEGYYALTACWQVENETSGTPIVACCFLLTGGSSNLNLSSGSKIYFGFSGCEASDLTGDTSVVLDDITPIAVYPGDTLEVVTYVNYSATADYNQNTSYSQGRWVPNFTGRWIRLPD